MYRPAKMSSRNSFLTFNVSQTVPTVNIEPDVKDVLSRIRQEHVGSGQFSFVSSETVSAIPLVDYVVKSKEDYTEDQCRLLFFKIFQAVETLHQRNVVHRSIRRENIYVQVGVNDLRKFHTLDGDSLFLNYRRTLVVG